MLTQYSNLIKEVNEKMNNEESEGLDQNDDDNAFEELTQDSPLMGSDESQLLTLKS